MSADKLIDKGLQFDRERPQGDSAFVDIAHKLGIVLPAGLLLLTATAADAAVKGPGSVAEANASVERARLADNEVAARLFGYINGPVKLAADCTGIHGDNHVNKDSPNVMDLEGHHGNVHTDQHGDSCRY